MLNSQPTTMLRADQAASKNGFAFCAATKDSTFRDVWTLLFYAQSISKVLCAKHFHKILDNNYATYSLVFATSQTIFTDFFGLLKTSEKLSFFKNQKDEKVPGFPFPSAIGGCPTTFRGYTSVAAKLVKKSKRTRIFPNWVLSAERKTQQWRVAAVVGWRLAFFQNAARSALLHFSYSSLSYNVPLLLVVAEIGAE